MKIKIKQLYVYVCLEETSLLLVFFFFSSIRYFCCFMNEQCGLTCQVTYVSVNKTPITCLWYVKLTCFSDGIELLNRNKKEK